jgi:hypothetical protein
MYIVETHNEEGTVIERKTFGYASHGPNPLQAARNYITLMREHLRAVKRDGCTVGLNLDD